MKILIAATAIALLSTAVANASVVDFDDLTASNFNSIQSSYDGINWDNNHYVYSDATNPFWFEGTVSGSNALFNAFGLLTTSVTSGAVFDFTGAWFKEWWLASEMTVEGYNSGLLVGSVTMALTDQYEWLQADFIGVDELRFVTDSSSSWWLMDDFTVNETQVAEPSIVALLGLGLLGLGMSRKRSALA